MKLSIARGFIEFMEFIWPIGFMGGIGTIGLI
jgi:hypothetical protein